MRYNSSRKSLIIPEYGRSIQQLVDHCKTIEDRESRTKFAHSIIGLLGTMNNHLRDVPEFQHKLWDQLFIMAEFELDVDSPFPIPSKLDLNRPPNKIPYPIPSIEFRYYGNLIKRMINVACTWEEGEKKDGLVISIANQMKKSYVKWNKDQVSDSTIFEHLKKLSNNKIVLNADEEELVEVQEVKNHHSPSRHKHKSRKKNNK